MTEQNTEFIKAISAIVSQIDARHTDAKAQYDEYLKSMTEGDNEYVPISGVTILRDESKKMSGTVYKGTFYSVKASLSAGYISVLKTEVPTHIQNDINALTATRNELVTLVTDYLRSRVIGVKKTRNSSGTPGNVKASQSKKDAVAVF